MGFNGVCAARRRFSAAVKDSPNSSGPFRWFETWAVEEGEIPLRDCLFRFLHDRQRVREAGTGKPDG